MWWSCCETEMKKGPRTYGDYLVQLDRTEQDQRGRVNMRTNFVYHQSDQAAGDTQDLCAGCCETPRNPKLAAAKTQPGWQDKTYYFQQLAKSDPRVFVAEKTPRGPDAETTEHSSIVFIPRAAERHPESVVPHSSLREVGLCTLPSSTLATKDRRETNVQSETGSEAGDRSGEVYSWAPHMQSDHASSSEPSPGRGKPANRTDSPIDVTFHVICSESSPALPVASRNGSVQLISSSINYEDTDSSFTDNSPDHFRGTDEITDYLSAEEHRPSLFQITPTASRRSSGTETSSNDVARVERRPSALSAQMLDGSFDSARSEVLIPYDRKPTPSPTRLNRRGSSDNRRRSLRKMMSTTNVPTIPLPETPGSLPLRARYSKEDTEILVKPVKPWAETISRSASAGMSINPLEAHVFEAPEPGRKPFRRSQSTF